MVNSDKN